MQECKIEQPVTGNRFPEIGEHVDSERWIVGPNLLRLHFCQFPWHKNRVSPLGSGCQTIRWYPWVCLEV